MTQISRIIQYLEEGNKINCLDAFDKLAVTQLATRISQIMDKGYDIKRERKVFVNKYGEELSLVEYSMRDK